MFSLNVWAKNVGARYTQEHVYMAKYDTSD